MRLAALTLTALSAGLLGYTHLAMSSARPMDTMSHSSLSVVQCVGQCATGTSEKTTFEQKNDFKDEKEPSFANLTGLGAFYGFIVLGIVLSPLFRRSSWRPPDLLILYNRSLLYA